ncbi:MAG: PepSY-associated TM helix domain-containing protein [Myxococcota bacterium]
MPLFPRKDRQHRVSYDVHTWAGVVIGLLLYVMFFTGAIALVTEPLGTWEEPAHHEAATGTPGEWWASLPAEGDDVDRVSLTLPDPSHGHQAPTGMVSRDGDRTYLVWRSGAWAERSSHAASFLFRLHFLYHPSVPWMINVAGLISMAMLLALLTGLVIHLRDLWTDLDTFRPKLPIRAVWTDLHKVTAVIGLPFQLLFAYTGAVLCLSSFVIAAVALPLYNGDVDRLRSLLFETPPPIAAEAEPAPMKPLPELLTAAQIAAPTMEPSFVSVSNPGLATSEVRIGGVVQGTNERANILLEATTGEVRMVQGLEPPKPHQALINWLFALHFAQFGGGMVLVAYAVLALATCATILSGIAIWLGKRRRASDWGTWLLRGLTTGVGAGLPLACAGMLLASRVLPWSLTGRADWLEGLFVGLFVSALAWGLADRNESRAWAGMMGLTAVSCFLAPVFQATLTSAGLGGAQPQAEVVGVDIGFLVCGLLFATGAFGAARRARRLSEAVESPALAAPSLEMPSKAVARG